jgi:hypothetical protein
MSGRPVSNDDRVTYDDIAELEGVEEGDPVFATLSDYYLDGAPLGAAQALYGTAWSDVKPHIDTLEGR